MSLTANVNQKANLIWAIADKMVGVFKPHQYGEIILPFAVLKRFDSILEATKEQVLAKYPEVKGSPMEEAILCKISGHPFYNTSKFNFKTLLDSPNNIEENFNAYLNGYSKNVREIMENFEFYDKIAKLADNNLLYIITQEFNTPKADLHPDKISNIEMGYIVEEIIRRFSEAHNENAGMIAFSMISFLTPASWSTMFE